MYRDRNLSSSRKRFWVGCGWIALSDAFKHYQRISTPIHGWEGMEKERKSRRSAVLRTRSLSAGIPTPPSLKRFAADARPRTSRLNAEMQRCSFPAFTTTSGRVVCVVLFSLPIQKKMTVAIGLRWWCEQTRSRVLLLWCWADGWNEKKGGTAVGRIGHGRGPGGDRAISNLFASLLLTACMRWASRPGIQKGCEEKQQKKHRESTVRCREASLCLSDDVVRCLHYVLLVAKKKARFRDPRARMRGMR